MRRALATSALLAATALAGCGEDEAEQFRKDYRPLNSQIRALGNDVGQSVTGASGKSDKQIQQQFSRLARRTGDLQEDVAALEPPDDLKRDQEGLAEAMGDAEGALGDIAKAAGDSDARAARQATIQLVAASEDLSQARRDLDKATAAPPES